MLNFFLRIFSRVLMLFLVLPVTNSVKGLVARWLGDDTADREGRITLNPLAHLDPLGSLAILICGFGWSKPLPINVTNMKDLKKGIILISLTAPVTHYLMAILCMNVYTFMALKVNIAGNAMSALYIILFFLANINVCLGTIDLLPLPPLDGFHILYQLANPKMLSWYHRNYQQINQYSTYILLGLFFIGTLTGGLIDPLGWLINLVFGLLSVTTSWIPLVFG